MRLSLVYVWNLSLFYFITTILFISHLNSNQIILLNPKSNKNHNFPNISFRAGFHPTDIFYKRGKLF